MLRLFDRCPGCGEPLIITECRCPTCQLTLRGEFSPGLFSTLTQDQLTFVREFLRVRGNLSELEKVLGVSYPTIRNKLDEINLSLDRGEQNPAAGQGQTAAPAAPDEARQAVLRRVASGEITAAEGARQLRSIQGGK